jgi:hypothetical protein
MATIAAIPGIPDTPLTRLQAKKDFYTGIIRLVYFFASGLGPKRSCQPFSK